MKILSINIELNFLFNDFEIGSQSRKFKLTL